MSTTTSWITKIPNICGGDACIQGHRIPVWGLVSYRRLGLSDPGILEAYPSLTQADLDAAWKYAEENAEEIDRAIRENEDDEEDLVE